MQWWCAAQGIPWEWSWKPYPGVWVFVLLWAVGYVLLLRRSGGSPRRVQIASFAAGLLALWAALDWPIGTLGSGYLASVHMIQFLLIALIAPPFLLLAAPVEALEALFPPGLPRRLLRLATHPVVTLLAFQLVIVATHWPAVVDSFMATQPGSFALDMAWLAGGLLFWWPVVAPVPRRPSFAPPLRIAYLILATVLATGPYAFLTLSELPFYRIYELAPPVSGIDVRQDQRLAGLLMKLGGGAVLWTAAGILFFRWFAREGD